MKLALLIIIYDTCFFGVFPSQAPELVFKPALEQGSPDSFHSLVESLLEDVFNFTTLVPRVAKHKELPDYHSDVEEVMFHSLTSHVSDP